MAERTRLVLIGGFLGSGKTTLINKLAQRYIEEKKSIGVITNDQGKYLIDTEFVKVRGIDVGEVTGSCFCCNFPKFFENVERLSGECTADYIFAEPVGSCTDLMATIMTPLRSFHKEKYSTAPLIVLVDGARMFDRALDSVNLGGYLRHHQVAEAEYIVLTKTDILGPKDVEIFLNDLKEINPDAKVITYSAITGEGFDEIVDIINSDEESKKKPVYVDYVRYADAEAELGWYNGIFEFTADGYDAYDLAAALLEDLGTKYSPSDVAHAKVAFTSDDGHVKVSLIGSEVSIGGVYGTRELSGKVQLNFNARIASEPDRLRDAIRETVKNVLTSKGVKDCKMIFDDCFSPGKPNPTYRMIDG